MPKAIYRAVSDIVSNDLEGSAEVLETIGECRPRRLPPGVACIIITAEPGQYIIYTEAEPR